MSSSTPLATVEAALERPSLRTPRSAAYAGIVFSVLAFASLLAVHIALVDAPADSSDWLTNSRQRDTLWVLAVSVAILVLAGRGEEIPSQV